MTSLTEVFTRQKGYHGYPECVCLCVCMCQYSSIKHNNINNHWLMIPTLGDGRMNPYSKVFVLFLFGLLLLLLSLKDIKFEFMIIDSLTCLLEPEGLTYIHRQNTDVFRVYRKTFIIFAMHVCMYRVWLTKRIRIWYIVLKGNPLGNHKSRNFHSLFIPVNVVRCVVILSLSLLKTP